MRIEIYPFFSVDSGGIVYRWRAIDEEGRVICKSYKPCMSINHATTDLLLIKEALENISYLRHCPGSKGEKEQGE